MSFKICIEHATESYKECLQYADNGVNKCNSYRDNGYNSCREFKKVCCTWWPCNWLCEIASWFCVAWYWVSNIVCIGWVWVSAIVCIAWTTINVVTCLTWALIDILLIPIAVFLSWIYSIPVLGRALKNFTGIVSDIGARGLSIPDAALTLLGVKKLKKIKLNVLILRDEQGAAIINVSDFYLDFNKSRDILKREANIDLYIEKITTMTEKGYSEILDVACNEKAFFQDLLFTGSGYEGLASKYFVLSGSSRAFGINPTIVVFIVRDFKEGKTHLDLAGCSMFSNTDYITISGKSVKISAEFPGGAGGLCDGTLAHEIGHKCGLLHVKDNNDNLMWSNEEKPLLGTCSLKNTMYPTQVAWVRMSKYVTS